MVSSNIFKFVINYLIMYSLLFFSEFSSSSSSSSSDLKDKLYQNGILKTYHEGDLDVLI